MKWLAAIFLALFTLPLAAAPTAADIEAYRALADMDKRVATIGYRLTAANAPFCKNRQHDLGWSLHDIAQYPDADVARAAFGFHLPVQIAAVAPDGPAAQADIRPGDALRMVRSRSGHVRFGENERKPRETDPQNFELMQIGLAGLLELAAGAEVEVMLTRDGMPLSIPVMAKPVCLSRFFVDTKEAVDAGADGERVRVTAGLLAFTPDDDELAAVLAHEMAHNLLGHRERLNAVRKGKTKATYATEVEADRLSVWLMANAGYDTQAALTFAERFGRKYGLGIFSAGTHPRWKKRVATMRAEIALIAAMPKISGLHDPPLLANNRPQ